MKLQAVLKLVAIITLTLAFTFVCSEGSARRGPLEEGQIARELNDGGLIVLNTARSRDGGLIVKR